MGNKVFLALAFHNHQPVGNFPEVIERVWNEAYQPLIATLAEHPRVKVTLHTSGPLRDWIVEAHPDWMGMVRDMVEKGRAEVMGGAYYEPILPVIPDKDKLGQLRKMNAAVRNDFGRRPRGAWLAERVWEPHLPKFLREAGLEYVVVDDSHLIYAGLGEEELLGYYLTEEQGLSVAVFPSSTKMRYLVPWAPIEEVQGYLLSLRGGREDVLAFMGDDGEKFGHWPGTHELCYTKGWLHNFLQWVEEQSGWLQTVTLGEYLQLQPPLGRVYLPAAAYPEMMEWALPARRSHELEGARTQLEHEGNKALLRYIRGGFWRNFLVKYPEANLLHKKMLRVSRKTHSSTRPRKAQALEHLWRAQCNCPYWHGVFGGIYYPHLREAYYQHLIRAEALADAPERWRWERTDLDTDGHQELLVEGPAQNLYFHLRNGGSLIEWDLREPAFNLTASVSRRPEAYHFKILDALSSGQLKAGVAEGAENIHLAAVALKDPAVASGLHYDAYQRTGLVDHLLSEDASVEGWWDGDPAWLTPLPRAPYAARVKRHGGGLEITFDTGKLGASGSVVRIRRKLTLPKDSRCMRVRYVVANLGESPVRGWFGTEFNWAVAAGGARWEVSGASAERGDLSWRGAIESVPGLRILRTDIPLDLYVSLEPPSRLWMTPLETAVYSLEGVELACQALSTLFLWGVEIPPGSRQTVAALEVRWE